MKASEPDSSDEEGAHLASPTRPTLPPAPSTAKSISVGTQTIGTMLEHLTVYAESSRLAVVRMDPVRDQFWASVLACMKLPRGGVDAGGSMHCSFEFIAASESIVKHLMEDLPLKQNQRYNGTLTPPAIWEDSPSISTYHALNLELLDQFFRLHRRRAASRSRVYRG